ncbi:adenylyl-sulfate kinase [Thioalkalivibrio sp. HK1]|uniref:adenylyl-sulfate kinase n=1 Tax=Thioalkalivibrio sp. HK1 TaxID=1469245 RepID=UPI000471E251|nr:adenylyl-sulfate kinase [Thioalkalivibrio sp. HK1]
MPPRCDSSPFPLRPLLVDDDEAKSLRQEIARLPAIVLSMSQMDDLELLLSGAFTPLDGFMDQENWHGVLESMRLADGSLWPMPLTLDVDAKTASTIEPGAKIALQDPEGLALAVLEVSERWRADKRREAQGIYGTASEDHPGVRRLEESVGEFRIGGRVRGLHLPQRYDYLDLRHTPKSLRRRFVELGWQRIVAFHTARPIHKAERAMTLEAAQAADARLLIHPVITETTIPGLRHLSRMRSYRSVLRHYPPRSALLSLLPLATYTAGPKEALWHALIRRNYGCTGLIVETDHASPTGQDRDHPERSIYPPWAALELALRYEEELGIAIIPGERMAWAPSRQRFVRLPPSGTGNGDANGDRSETSAGKERHLEAASDDFESPEILMLSDAECETRLARGSTIPHWYSWPEVIDDLRKAFPPPHKQGFTLFFTGLSGSGKSTLARIIYGRLIEEEERPVSLLDGDVVRRHLSSELGFSKAHRDINIRRIGFVAGEITKNGGIAICAPIAPYADTRRDVREMIEAFGAMIEIHVCTPLSVCESRDPKGLYVRARKGLIPEFTGISDPYEAPKTPEIRIDTTDTDPGEAVREIFRYLNEKGFIGSPSRHRGEYPR